MDWYLKVLKNYVGFRGRARRKEYWMFILVNIIFTFVLGLLDKMLGWQRAGGEGILTTIYGILVFLPWWAVQFRRLFNIRGIYHNHPDFRWFSSPAGRISVPLQGVKNVSSVFQEVFCAEHALIVHNGQASVFQLKQIVHPQLIGFHHRNI